MGAALVGGGLIVQSDPTTSAPPPPPRTEPRRLYRRTDHKVIAGVASGLGDYFRVDPVLFRIAFVALAFAGGLGVFLYGVAWLIMPPSHGGPSAGEEALRRVGGERLAALIAVVLLVIGAGLVVDQFGVHRPDLVWGGVLIALGILLFHHATTRDEESSEPASPPPGTPAPAAPPVDGEEAPAFAGREARRAQWRAERARRRGERSGLGWGTIGVLFLAEGVAVLLDNSNAISLSLAQYFALALLILAAGLVVGAWVGRARWLAFPALLVIPAVVMAGLVTVPLEGGFGDRLYRPVTAADANHAYRLIAGRMTLDLSAIQLGGGSASVTASIMGGELRVIAPPRTTVDVRAQIGAGEMDVFGRTAEGLKLDRRVTSVRAGTNVVHLDLAVSFGRIFVGRG